MGIGTDEACDRVIPHTGRAVCVSIRDVPEHVYYCPNCEDAPYNEQGPCGWCDACIDLYLNELCPACHNALYDIEHEEGWCWDCAERAAEHEQRAKWVANPTLENWHCPICKELIRRDSFEVRELQHLSHRYERPFHDTCGKHMTPEDRHIANSSP